MYKILKRAFLDTESGTFSRTGNFLAVVTIISILAVVLETVPSLVVYEKQFLFIELVAVIIFLAEYIGRLLVTRPKHKYVFSFLGIVDLLAILPTILGLGNLTFLKSARAIRIIRLLRMLRLVKITRVPKDKDMEESFGVYGFNVLIYGATLLLSLLIMGTLIYLTEPDTKSFASIPAGMWWSLKVFMGGVSVTVPDTQFGEVVYVATRFVGLLLFGLLVGVVGNIFRLLLLREK
ncbi:MAG: ion transporter [Candidatus Paceibacterota bacterium]